MDTVIFREHSNDRDECDQWTLVRNEQDHEDFVIQKHIKLDHRGHRISVAIDPKLKAPFHDVPSSKAGSPCQPAGYFTSGGSRAAVPESRRRVLAALLAAVLTG